ncbi:MAG TPA: DUF4097 family beta strand repeat-containing protein [Gemmatimonadales bacterium]
MHQSLSIALLLALAAPGLAAQGRVLSDDDWCDRDWGRGDDRERLCEVREIIIPAGRSTITIDAEPNGGITVEGWDRNEIRIRAKVVVHARSDDAAREIADEVRIVTDGIINADGPERLARREWWSVSFDVSVPRRSNLDLESTNGGIGITDVEGTIAFRTTNGGVHLTRLAGDVRGRSTNGGMDVALDGTEWRGAGLDVSTTNGGVKLAVPPDYNARLETGTTNGHIRADFPLTVQGRIDRNITAELGRGGKTIRVMTTNGGVVLRRGAGT